MKASKQYKSEKIHNIAGQVPVALFRYGMIIIITIILCSIVFLFPYKKYVHITITLFTNPPISLIKSSHEGTVIIDTTIYYTHIGVCIANIIATGKITPLYSEETGQIIYSVSNNQKAPANSLIAVVIPQNISEIYGEAEIEDDWIPNIKEKQKVTGTDNTGKTYQGYISKVYPFSVSSKNKIRINFDTQNLPSSHLIQIRGKILLYQTVFGGCLFR